jgi:hypothetical protein
MVDHGFVDRIRIRVFLTELPGMTRDRERRLIHRCRRLVESALAAGVPLTVTWNTVAQLIDRIKWRLRTEHERETFVAIMQRLRAELFQEQGCVSR